MWIRFALKRSPIFSGSFALPEPAALSGRPRLLACRVVSQRADRRTVFSGSTERTLREATEGYSTQMADYALAAARLLNLSIGQLTTCLLFTRTGQRWTR